MKKLLLLVCIICSCSCVLVAQATHSMCEFTNRDTLRVCQDNPIVIIQKDPTFSENPYWITENGEIYHENEVTINHQNAGWLLYTEKEPEKYKNIYVLFQPLPEEDTIHLLIEDDEIITLKATPQNIPTFQYEWDCGAWPQNTVFYGYELPINKEGIYRCFVNDQCNTATIVTFVVDKKPSISFVTTNLQIGKPMIYWDTYPNAIFDSVAIYRNDVLIAVRDFWMGCYNDINFEGGQPQKYKIAAWYNGSPYTNKSNFKRPIWLYVSGITNEGINYGWWKPENEQGSPIEYFVRYYQLYEKLENGFGQIYSMIPANQNELVGVEDIYGEVVLAAVLHDGRVIYSNVVRPNNYTKIEDDEEDGKDGAEIGYIYPNPTTGIINLPSNVIGEFRIFDLNGKIMLNGITEKSEINVSSLSAGMYTIVIYKNGKKTFVNKFIRE